MYSKPDERSEKVGTLKCLEVVAVNVHEGLWLQVFYESSEVHATQIKLERMQFATAHHEFKSECSVCGTIFQKGNFSSWFACQSRTAEN